MTIKDVARYCGVSVSTVSRALNGHPDVSDAVREKVLAAANELHYVPNKSAQDLARAQADSIGLVVRGAENPFFSPIIHAIENKCDAADYTMLMRQISSDANELDEASEFVNTKRLKGLILLGGRFDYHRSEMAGIDVPYVCCTFGNDFGDLDPDSFSSVCIDDVAVSYEATRYLIDAGHTKIAVVLDNPSDHSIAELRFGGYKKALAEAGIEFDPALVVETGTYSMAAARERTARLLERRPDVTAIFCIADTLALAAMKGICDTGRSVPDDVSVISIDGIEVSEYVTPTLTTLCQPQDRLGAYAVEILLNFLSGENGGRHVRLGAALREGGTVSVVK